jgi:hypothetical protein
MYKTEATMAQSRPTPATTYSPLYFLASLGAGGLAVTFFMYLMFWVPHPGQPVPVFEDIMAAWSAGGLGMKAAIAIAVTGIAGFTVLNVKALIWNLTQLSRFKKTEDYTKLINSNAETQLAAMPLALAMTVNAGFIVGLVFVPGLWSVIEYLFPLALIAFVLLGAMTLRIIGRFLGRIMSEPEQFNTKANNSFAQALPAFALAMVAVGLSAPAAMSQTPAIVGTSLVLSGALGMIALLYTIVSVVSGMQSILQNGVAKEAAPTLMIIVPILTILGIMFLRQSHGLHTTFDVHTEAGSTLMTLSRILAVQFAFGLLGLIVMRRQGYVDTFLRGTTNSAGSYALVCPGVALSVMLHFWINKGLVGAGVIASFGTVYWGLTAVAIGFQVAMILLVLYLNHRHFGRSADKVLAAA